MLALVNVLVVVSTVVTPSPRSCDRYSNSHVHGYMDIMDDE